MMHILLAFAAVLGAEVTPPVVNATGVSNAQAPKIDRFADRPQARIPFTNQVRNFQVKRDGYDDVLYLETQRNRWFRSEIDCFGINDPLDAQGLLPLDHGFGFSDFSRIALVGFGHRTTECRLNRLVELTPDETVELGLVRRREPPAAKVSPAS
jgi:hypothetical protein